MKQPEIRFATELRAGDGEDMTLIGYAANFNTPSTDKSLGFTETIAPGAFTRALNEKQDVKCLYNHGQRSDVVLGRTTSGTLTLKQDDKGLFFRCVLDPNQQAHRDLHSSVKRGDVNGCSFAFAPNGNEGDEWSNQRSADGSWYISRVLKDVNLFDVSAVTNPAYGGTNIQAREATMTQEFRGIIDKLVAQRATGTQGEKHDESVEQVLRAINKALAEAYPQKENADTCCGSYGQYYICETYEDHVIASNNWGPDPSEYVSIPFVANPDGTGYVFGTPVPVEKEWVPSERTAKLVEEKRTMHSSHLQQLADAHKDQSAQHSAVADAHTTAADTHDAAAAALQAVADKKKEEERIASACKDSMGNCAEERCTCQNRSTKKDDVWDGADDMDDDDWADEERATTNKAIELRSDGTVLTKLVDGKELSAKYFAFVGDSTKTTTWSLPIQDKAHADNAAARFNQTEGIPEEQKAGVLRRIKAAQKKFGEVPPPDGRMTKEEIEDMNLRFQLAMVAPDVRGCLDQRYSDDQPRDDHGRFGSGDMKSSGPTVKDDNARVGFGKGVKGDAGKQYVAQQEAISKHMEDIKSGLAAHATNMDKHWGHVGDLAHHAAALKEIADQLHHRGEYARSATDPAEEVRYSDDQARDDNGRFAGGGSIGRTSSGKDIPSADHKVYNEAQKMPKYNGKVSPANAHGRDGGKMLAQRLPDFTKADHLEAYAAHTAAAAEQGAKWSAEYEKAAQETFGRPSQIGDYKISAIGSDKFSDASKDKLRDAAHTETDHKQAATAHWYAAGKHGRPE